ncbi:MAG: OmpA family protein [Pseudomonadota bacterium]
MIKKIKLGLIASAILASSTLFAEGTQETIFFIGDDLKTGISYKNVRYPVAGKKGMYFGSNYNKNNLSYIKPNNYSWSKESQNGKINDLLSFPNTNSYAYLERISLKDNLGLLNVNNLGEKEDGSYYVVLDGGSCTGTDCLADENIISVVVPKRFKIVSYEAKEKRNEEYKYNADADFKLIDNTLTLYTNNLQGAYVRLWFKDTSLASAIYKNVSDSLAKFSDISVSKTDTTTTISMPMDNVFTIGKANMNNLGKEWMATLAETLKEQSFKEIRVEGHTDNVPMKGGAYPSNWELSSARASDAVKFMISKGIDSKSIAAVGYADTHPLVANDTKENRAKNRRIEITIVGNSEKAAD